MAKNIYDWVVNKVANKNGVKNEKAYIIDFSVANLKNGKKIAYAKKMAQASDDILNKIKTDYRAKNTQQSVLDKNISQPNKNVKYNQKFSMSEQLENQASNLVE